MAQSVSGAPQFFLGIAGKQTGPFTESQVLNQIQRGEVPQDALVWYEGLSDWQPIRSIEYFKGAFGGPRVPAKTAGGFTPLDEVDGDLASVNRPINARGAEEGDILTKKRSKKADAEDSGPLPGFKDEGFAAFDGSAGKKKTALLGVLLGSVVIGGIAYFYVSGDTELPSFTVPTISAAPGGRQADPAPTDRNGRTRKALSELLLTPEDSLRTLIEIAQADPKDSAGQEAATAVIEFYKQRQRHHDAGRFLMKLNRPIEAWPLFLQSPPQHSEAEAALFAAYSESKEVSRKELLLKDIDLLLGPISNFTLAEERIQTLEKDFPGERHPYGYYLMKPEQKIRDLFQRISFHYVQNLLGFMASEMPEINFVNRPLVEIKKDAAGTYRIVGNYKGEVVLSQDRLKNIRFAFWFFNETWSVVETNLTIERQRFSAQLKKSRMGDVLTADKMLEQLQNTFRTLYPKGSFHEKVTRATASSKSSPE